MYDLDLDNASKFQNLFRGFVRIFVTIHGFFRECQKE